MQALPRDVVAPRLGPRSVTLTPLPELGPAAVRSDDLVTEHEVGELALGAHSSEFVEFASLRITGGSLADSDWYRTNWVDVELSAVDAANTSFTEAGLKRIAWQQCRMVGIGLPACTLTDVAHQGCRMSMANFRFATLCRVEFVDCDLSGADFSSARLDEVTFSGCTLTGATFTQASARRVLLTGGTLSGLRGLDGLRGATIRVDDLAEIAQEMAIALGFELVEG